MKSLMQQALGESWQKLPPALKAHYQTGAFTETGTMDIEYPKLMQPYFSLLRCLGAMPDRQGTQLPTTVKKKPKGDKQQWNRVISYPNGKTIHFDSVLEYAGGNELIEYVNPFFGLKMAIHVEGDVLCYQGVCLLIKCGPLIVKIPEWLALGHTSIREEQLDQTHFKMDFRLTHPWFGEVFRYAGEFEVNQA